MFALREAILKPEVIFFLTDADSMTNGDVDRNPLGGWHDPDSGLSSSDGGPCLGQKTPLARLATTTGGSYLYIDENSSP